MGGGGGKGVGGTWPDTVKQTGAGGTLTPTDRHGSVQVSATHSRPRHFSSLSLFIAHFPRPSVFFHFHALFLPSSQFIHLSPGREKVAFFLLFGSTVLHFLRLH